YREKLEKNMVETDLEVKRIIDNAQKKKKLELSKLYSNTKISEKKEYMLVREKCFNKLMDSLKSYVDVFVKSCRYKDYLLKLFKDLYSEKLDMKSITVYVTKDDLDKYSELLNKGFMDLGYIGDNLNILSAKDKIIGGFVIEDNIDKLRINLSIKSLLDDNKPFIMQALFEALEAGENND
ncbi:MAG: V-type ATP synthase subunit E family protein, partial [Clostridium sp.]